MRERTSYQAKRNRRLRKPQRRDSSENVDPGNKQPLPEISLSDVRVLVVDDEIDSREFVKALLEGVGAVLFQHATLFQDFVFSFLLDFFVSPFCARCLLTILEATSSSRPG
jgi:hypothetical protein